MESCLEKHGLCWLIHVGLTKGLVQPVFAAIYLADGPWCISALGFLRFEPTCCFAIIKPPDQLHMGDGP